MRTALLGTLVFLSLSPRLVLAQASLAPPTAAPPGPIEPPVQFPPLFPAVPPEAPAPQIQPFELPPEAGGPLGRVWARAEYLMWWIRDTRLPPLVTANRTGPVPVLGLSSTSVVVGGGELDNQDRSGARFTVGFALDSAQSLGVEASYFLLGSRTTTVGAGST